MKIMNTIRRPGRPARLLILIAAATTVLWCQPPGGRGAAPKGSEVVSIHPLYDVANALQNLYGRVVTYEDPVWEWSGDAQPRGNGKFLFPVTRSFSAPSGLTPAESPVLDGALLGKVLDEYHRRNDAPRFRVSQSAYGLHIIPETVRDSSGRSVPAKNPLDAVVTIPVAARTASGNLEAICGAVTQAVGMKVNCLAVGWGNDGDWYERLFAAPGPQRADLFHTGNGTGAAFAWGAASVPARDALDELLGHSATTFTWAFGCQAAAQAADRTCFLGLARINGLAYDRCPGCAPLPGGPSRGGRSMTPPPIR